MKRRVKIQNHLYKYRKQMGMTQKEVACLLGHKDQTQVCNWEKGIKVPSAQNAIRLSILYRKPVAFLFHPFYMSEREMLRAREEKLQVKSSTKILVLDANAVPPHPSFLIFKKLGGGGVLKKKKFFPKINLKNKNI